MPWKSAPNQDTGRVGASEFSERPTIRVRPTVPRAQRARLRSLLARTQGRRPFPGWPIECTLHDFYAFLFNLLADIAGTWPPVLAPWPDD